MAVGCSGQPPDDPTAVPLAAAFSASDARTDDQFGYHLAISGDGSTVVVGAYAANRDGMDKAGKAYVFARAGRKWVQQAGLQASEPHTVAYFGISTALSNTGDTLAVGAHFEDTVAGPGAGAAYVFARTGTDWGRPVRITGSDTRKGEHFGTALAMTSDGNTIAVGAHFADNNGGVRAGSTYLFHRVGASWVQDAKLVASDAAAGDYFGVALAFSQDGNTLAVSAYGDDNTGGVDAGSVYVFARVDHGWREQARLQAQDAAAGDTFGTRVALSGDGDTLATGAYLANSSAGTGSGKAYVFMRSRGVWHQQARLLADDARRDDAFGSSVALSADGKVVAVGASMCARRCGTGPGVVYVFQLGGAGWREQHHYRAADGQSGMAFGTSMAMSLDGNALAAGAYKRNQRGAPTSGSAYLIERNTP